MWIELAIVWVILCVYGRMLARELNRCPETTCREEGIVDVDRHVKIFHPGLFWPVDSKYGYGMDPRPDEDPKNALRGNFERDIRRLR